jgi:hypothetical protein
MDGAKILLSLKSNVWTASDLTKLFLDLPAKRKRFELFKFYSQVGEDRINWDYFAKQMV